MLRRIPWFLRVSVLVAVVLAVSLSVFQSWSTGAPGTGGWTQTQWGPLGPADRDLLVKVRLAGLWEAPTGQQADQQASTAQVREVGAPPRDPARRPGRPGARGRRPAGGAAAHARPSDAAAGRG